MPSWRSASARNALRKSATTPSTSMPSRSMRSVAGMMDEDGGRDAGEHAVAGQRQAGLPDRLHGGRGERGGSADAHPAYRVGALQFADRGRPERGERDQRRRRQEQASLGRDLQVAV